MSSQEFGKIGQFITQEFGIKMPPSKKLMLEGRLHRRLTVLNFKSYQEYIEYLFSEEGKGRELIPMLDVVTTHKTDFFREPIHFEYLRETILPAYYQRIRQNVPLKIWSAGCSSGEEAYTIAMVVDEFTNGGFLFDYNIMASDVSMKMLQDTRNAVYTMDRIAAIPMELKRKYFLKSKDKLKPTVRIIPRLRSKISLKWLNLIEDQYPVTEQFDIVFCRNVLIYFDRNNQEQVINKLCRHLKPGGYFFLGHSETITNMQVPLKAIKPTVFLKH